MLKNYFKITFRNLFKNKAYLSINLLGLTLGVACALLIFVVIRYQNSFDNFHTKADRLYRVYSYENKADKDSYNGGSSLVLPTALRTDFSDLEGITQVYADGSNMVFAIQEDGKAETTKYMEYRFAFVEPEFFAMFTYPLLIGEAKSAMKEPNSVILTEKIAKKYFGNNEKAIGKIIRWDNKLDLKVTGIAKDVPKNTDIRFEIFISYASLHQFVDKEEFITWGSISSAYETFVLLPEKYTQAQVEARMPAFREKYITKNDQTRNYALQPLKEMHFDERLGNFNGSAVSLQMLWALGLISIFLIITACINFINLATAQAVKRSKEVGIRKVLGSSRVALIQQFLGETFFITTIAVLLAMVCAEYLLPYVNDLLGMEIEKHFLWNKETGFFLIGLTFVVTLLSGFYPALVLSGFNPVLAIKNSITSNHAGGMSLRRGLVIAQFAISQVLVTSTLIAVQQMDYFQSKDVGFNKKGVVVLTLPKNDSLRFNTLKAELQRITEIEKISFAMTSPASGNNAITNVGLTGKDSKDDVDANMKRVDADYLEVYGLKLAAGRNMMPTDTLNEVLINETLARRLGFKTPEEALGKTLRRGKSPKPIVGVLKDFHVNSLHRGIDPVYMGAGIHRYETAGVKFSTKNTKEMMGKIEKLWSSVFPEYVFEYEFLDESLARFYQGEKQLSNLFKIFAFIAIFIGCIGLYGLVSFMATQKNKEIGIRKVMGASVGQIVYLFSKEFAKLLLVAFVIASPIIYYVMSGWLADFEYRVNIGWQVFVISIVSSALIACFTVGYKSLRAALANPVKSLRSE